VLLVLRSLHYINDVKLCRNFDQLGERLIALVPLKRKRKLDKVEVKREWGNTVQSILFVAGLQCSAKVTHEACGDTEFCCWHKHNFPFRTVPYTKTSNALQ